VIFGQMKIVSKLPKTAQNCPILSLYNQRKVPRLRRGIYCSETEIPIYRECEVRQIWRSKTPSKTYDLSKNVWFWL